MPAGLSLRILSLHTRKAPWSPQQTMALFGGMHGLVVDPAVFRVVVLGVPLLLDSPTLGFFRNQRHRSTLARSNTVEILCRPNDVVQRKPISLEVDYLHLCNKSCKTNRQFYSQSHTKQRNFRQIQKRLYNTLISEKKENDTNATPTKE